MARTKKYTPEETLRSLFNLQFIDSRIDNMREVRGELPMEVKDLEDEMVGLNKRLEKVEEETEGLNQLILEKKNIIEESKSSIKKYLEKQKNVRNNREFDSLSKEIEYQELEAQLAEKRIKENSARIDGKSVNQLMCKVGHAVAYYGQNKSLIEKAHLKNRSKV